MIVAETPVQPVIAGLATQYVVTRASVHPVVPGTGIDNVVPRTAADEVVPGGGPDQVDPIGSHDHVVIVRSLDEARARRGDRCRNPVAGRHGRIKVGSDDPVSGCRFVQGANVALVGSEYRVDEHVVWSELSEHDQLLAAEVDGSE